MIFLHEIDPVLFQMGTLNLHWYSFFSALGVLLCYLLLKRVFRSEGIPQNQLESLMIYAVVGMFVGARVGYALFYQYDYFLIHPTEIFKLWKPGLSSHGAAIGTIAAVFIWSRIWQQKFLHYMGLLSLGLPIILACIRMGNFINSEAVGVPTSGDWGVVFVRLGEDFPRHPSQLYEIFFSLGILLYLHWIFSRNSHADIPTKLTFLLGLLYFTSRFILGIWKPGNVLTGPFSLSIEQVLSIPPITVALCFLAWLRIRR